VSEEAEMNERQEYIVEQMGVEFEAVSAEYSGMEEASIEAHLSAMWPNEDHEELARVIFEEVNA
jgi:hypothetical protein